MSKINVKPVHSFLHHVELDKTMPNGKLVLKDTDTYLQKLIIPKSLTTYF